MTRLIVLLLFFITITTSVYAAWTGPVEVVSGAWGKDKGSFGILYEDMEDSYPDLEAILPNTEIVIDDQVNDRILVYDQKGRFLKEVPWILTQELNEEEYYQVAEYWMANIKRFSKDGDYWMKSGNGAVHFNVQNIDISHYDDTPLELGIVKQKSIKNQKYLSTIRYEDKTYEINGYISSFVRDQNDYLYSYGYYTAIDPVSGTDSIAHYVFKYDTNGKKVSKLTLPTTEYEPVSDEEMNSLTGPNWTIRNQYGQPIISADGSVYCSKRTPDTYSILKWAWVNEYDFLAVDYTKHFKAVLLADLDKQSLRFLRNSIFARRGRIFKSQDLNEYFSSKDWYQPRHDFKDGMLSDIDKSNIGLIMKYEAEK